MKKQVMRCFALMAVLLFLNVFSAAAKTPDIGDLIKFIPTKYTVTSNRISVEGYFVNMNTDKIVKNFTDFEMKFYDSDGDLLASGNFGDLNTFSISPLRMKAYTFNYNGSHNLKTGTYVAGDAYCCVISMSFTWVQN